MHSFPVPIVYADAFFVSEQSFIVIFVALYILETIYLSILLPKPHPKLKSVDGMLLSVLLCNFLENISCIYVSYIRHHKFKHWLDRFSLNVIGHSIEVQNGKL